MRLQRGFSIIFIFLAVLSLRTVWGQLPTPTPADTPNPPYVTVTYSDGSSVVAPGASGTFPLVGLQAAEPVQVVVQLTANHADELFTVQSLDGGVVAPPQ